MESTTEERSVKSRKSRSNNITVADYISQQIDLSGKSQLEIAREAGFNKPNIITMIKQGKTKLPMSKVGPMARALGVDPKHLYRLVMQEYEPDTWEALQDIIFTPSLTLTQNEVEIIECIRQSKVPNPRLRNDTERAALLAVIDTLKPENF